MIAVRRFSRNGFTLVEMLVALMIFAVIAGGALGLLRFSVDAEFASREKTDQIASARRLISVWSADMAQASPRPSRDGRGQMQPALLAGFDGDLLAVTRGGWDNPSGLARSSLQRVRWRMAGNDLVRIGQPFTDGAPEAAPAVMARLAGPPRLRFRGAMGNWTDRWEPEDPAMLPEAVEMILPWQGGGDLRLVTLVGSGPVDDSASGAMNDNADQGPGT